MSQTFDLPREKQGIKQEGLAGFCAAHKNRPAPLVLLVRRFYSGVSRRASFVKRRPVEERAAELFELERLGEQSSTSAIEERLE